MSKKIKNKNGVVVTTFCVVGLLVCVIVEDVTNHLSSILYSMCL